MKLFSLLASLFAVVPAVAGEAPRPAASTSGTSMFDVFIREPNVAFTGAVRYGPNERHRLDVFAPTDRAGGPIVVFYYGGAWTSGARETYEFVGTALAARGLTTVVADYRLYPEVRFPGFVEDAALAYGWVDRHLARTGGRRRPIFLMGHSAGAHIAALLAVDRRFLGAVEASPPAGLVGLAGPYAFDPTTWETTAAIFSTTAARPDRARPAHLVRHGGPPTLLLHGADDRTVGLFNTREFAETLAARGTDVRSIVYPGIGHVGLVSALAKPLRWRADVLDDIVGFIEARSGRRAGADTGGAAGPGRSSDTVAAAPTPNNDARP
jgi:acetyl esterase/lipase